MIRFASVFMIVLIMGYAAFRMIPLVLLSMLPDCTTETTFINAGSDMTIVSSGKWYLSTNSDESVGSYHGELLRIKPDGVPGMQKVSFSYETHNEIVGRAIRTTTRSFATNFDNTASVDDIYKYVYNGVKNDSVGFYRILRINDQFYASSLPNGLPRSVCNKAK